MRIRHVLLAASASLFALPAAAADQLKFGPSPSWVVPRPIPANVGQADQTSPFRFLLSDQQTRVEPGKIVTTVTSAFKLQTPEGLAMGNVSLPWDPARQTITVHRLEIHREGKVIDVLAGQQFTTIRREQNLEAATLDGLLTANIQPEGLQVGDVLLLSTTTEHADPVMKGHAEIGFGNWDNIPVSAAYARILWPENVRLQFRSAGGLPEARMEKRGGQHIREISATDVQPLIPPKGAPARFRLGRQGEATSFSSWTEVADLMRPLYESAAVVPKSGALRDELEKIRAATTDPIQRAEKALDLVEHRVRYVALLMGQGGYVPASAETTWARRFGDCKAKSALLLALLNEMGISAEPVLVNSGGSDGLDQRLPMVSHFNHVIVRANIGGTSYWLDGTRTGDSKLATLETPYYRWGLPLAPAAKLVAMVPDQPRLPQSERIIRIDASNGVYAPAPTTVEQILRGDVARHVNTAYGAMTAAQRTETIRQYWQERFTYLTIAAVDFKYDRDTAEVRMSAKGNAKLEWKDGWFYFPGSSIAFDPTFDRPAGPSQDAPIELNYPSLEKTVTDIRFPPSFIAAMGGASKLPSTVDERIAGAHYFRKLTLEGDRLVMEAREQVVAPELPYREALASAPRLKQLSNDQVHLRMPTDYRPTSQDLAALGSEEPTSGPSLLNRGIAFLNAGKFDQAIADFTKAAAIDPKDPWPLANRAVSYAWKRDFPAAEKDIAAAESLDGNNPVLKRGRGLMAHFKGDHAKAVKEFSEALKADPKDHFSLLNRANARLALGDLAESEADLDAYDKLKPGDVHAAFGRAEIARLRGDYVLAVDGFTKVLESKPGDASVLTKRSMVFAEMGKDDEALADAQAALQSHSMNSDLRMLRARIFKKRGQQDKAVAEADQLLKQWGQFEFTQVSAGQIYNLVGMQDRAMQAFARAIEIKPAPYIYVLRGHIRPVADHASRVSDFQAALKLDRSDLGALLSLAAELKKAGKTQEAFDQYDYALKAHPDQRSIKLYRALLLAKLGRASEAEKEVADYRKELKSAVEFNNLCWAKATSALMLNSAVEDCREALRLKPNEPAYLDSLGMAYLRLKKFDDSLAAYEKALAKRKFPASLMGRALAYSAKGDEARAKADAIAARAMDSNIDDEFAQYGLKFEDQKALTIK